MGVQAENLSGKIFCRLTVLRRSNDPKFKTPAWVCFCICGSEYETRAMSLKSGATRSCGCLNTETRTKLKTVHGASAHTAYKSWKAMMGRCHDDQDKDFAQYGGRGITVCERWHDLLKFIADVGERPKGYSLERVDNNKGYSPGNCRWATPLEQGANKRNNRLVVINGNKMHVADVARKFYLTETTIVRRLNSGMTGDQLVRVPVRKYERKAA